jgi:predicted esterase
MTGELAAREELIDDLRQVQFSFELAGERVPGLLYLPAQPERPLPLVLIQHPATSSKDDYFVADPARMWARRGWVCGGIDAPLHGDRLEHDPLAILRDRERFPQLVAQFSAELSATVDQLAERYPIDLARLGFVGYSLGSMLGLPAVAIDGRFRAAVFCLVGEGGLAGPATGPGSHAGRLGATAVRVVGKLHDELISRDSTEALYNAIPGPKDITWLPGGHFEIGPDVVRAAGDWLKERL